MVSTRRDRVSRRRKTLNLSSRATSLAVGKSPDYLRTVKRQADKGTQKNISPRVLVNLARVLQTTPEWLLYGVGPSDTEFENKAPDRAESHELRYRWVVSSVGTTYFVPKSAWLGEARICFLGGACSLDVRRRRHASNGTDSRGQELLLSPLRSALRADAFGGFQD